MAEPTPWREYTATVRYNEGYDLEEAGQIDAAIAAYRKAATLGAADAMSRLATLYAEAAPGRPEAAVRWYRRGVRAGDAGCAWNLAMHHSRRGKQRWYLHWLTVAARMGEPDADDEIAHRRWWAKHNPGDRPCPTTADPARMTPP